MAAPTGFGRAGASRFQLSHQSGATRRKNASIWCETTGGRHRLLNEINRLQPRQPWHAPCNNARSEEHTSELQSLMRISYAVFCLKKKIKTKRIQTTQQAQTITY